MGVIPLLIVLLMLSWGCFCYTLPTFWKELQQKHPQIYKQMGAPENLWFDISLWSIVKTYQFLLGPKRQRVPERWLRVLGLVSFWSGLVGMICFAAFFVLLGPKGEWP